MYGGLGGPQKPLSRIMFDKYDQDKSGFLDTRELKALCYELGHPLSPAEYELAYKMLDANGDGKISFAEFSQWWQQHDRFAKLSYDEEDLKELNKAVAYFNHFDKDKSGSIDKKEFKELFADLKKKQLALSTLEAALANLDANNDGTVSLKEFIDWLVSVNGITLKNHA